MLVQRVFTLLDALVRLYLPVEAAATAESTGAETETTAVDLAMYYPDATLVDAVTALLSHEDWGARADAVRVIRHWQTLPDVDRALLKPAVSKLYEVLAAESDPYVKFAGERVR